MNLFVIFMVFAVFGVSFEVFFTSVFDSIKDKNPRLKGRSSLWMFPIYGCLVFIVMLVQHVFGAYPWFIRGIMYAVLILAWEYASGFLIKKTVGVAPWDYSTDKSYDNVARKKKYQLHGLICLEYAPLWFIGGLLAEALYLFLIGL